MSLLSEAMEVCTTLKRQTTLDDVGGFINTWTDDTEFEAAITFDSSIQARTAAALNVRSLYTVTTERAFMLKYHDIFRRACDGKLFRVTSDGDDKFTPASAGLNMRQVMAEEIAVLPQ